jgi:hypothetical protein
MHSQFSFRALLPKRENYYLFLPWEKKLLQGREYLFCSPLYVQNLEQHLLIGDVQYILTE